VPEIDQIRGAQPDALADAAEPVVEGGAEPAGEAQPAEPGTAARTPLSRSVTGPSPSQSASAALARAAPTPAGPSAPAAQVPTGTALSREPPKVRDKAEKTSAAEKALGDATHSEPAATAVPAPIARSARPLRRLRPAGPARRVAPKPSLSVSREPRDPRRAESEVVAGAPTRDSVPTPDAATDGDAAPARGETVIEQATESGAGKAPDVADGTPLDRSVSTSREAERPTALARKASASEAGLEPSTGSAPVVANAPAAGTTAGGRSDEPVATPPGKPAAPPADMQAPATSEASPVTSAEAPADRAQSQSPVAVRHWWRGVGMKQRRSAGGRRWRSGVVSRWRGRRMHRPPRVQPTLRLRPRLRRRPKPRLQPTLRVQPTRGASLRRSPQRFGPAPRWPAWRSLASYRGRRAQRRKPRWRCHRSCPPRHPTPRNRRPPGQTPRHPIPRRRWRGL